MTSNVIFKKKYENTKKQIAPTYIVSDILTKTDFENLSLAVSEGNNHKETTTNVVSNRIYHVTEGHLAIMVGENSYDLDIGDLILIPKNTQYSFKGTFKAILIDSPAFELKNERIE
jgi:mannose-6-phosphate isomerase-like protein (cupin superfamily)